jgi:ABC-2 type transport system permease protein
MTTLALAARDSATMTRRSLRHVTRYPVTLVMAVVVPVLLLLLFIGVFGGALKAGLAAAPHAAYIDFIVPGIIVLTAGYGCQATTMAVNRDSTEGIIARFRTMAISPTSVLNGHVASAVMRTLVSVALVIGVSIGLGFRPGADAGQWLAVAGFTALLALALTWLAAAVGLAAKTVEGTTAFLLLVQLLPFIGSAFVHPPDVGSVQWFAAHQPFTPIIDTLRGLLTEHRTAARAHRRRLVRAWRWPGTCGRGSCPAGHQPLSWARSAARRGRRRAGRRAEWRTTTRRRRTPPVASCAARRRAADDVGPNPCWMPKRSASATSRAPDLAARWSPSRLPRSISVMARASSSEP